jgi:hypothetical protein
VNVRRVSIALVGWLALAASAVPVALAAPPSNGCPRGFEFLSVATLTAEGYHVPALVDSPTSGFVSFGQHPGNGDGWVCGVRLGNQLSPRGTPIYEFIDDQLPAS